MLRVAIGIVPTLVVAVAGHALAQDATPPAVVRLRAGELRPTTFAQVQSPTPPPGAAKAQEPKVPTAGTQSPATKVPPSEQSGGAGFPGATSSQGITNVQGENAKPNTAGAPPLPAGMLDVGHGVTVQLNYVSESAGNPIGGIRRGVEYADQILLGIDTDLKKLTGADLGTIHIIGTQRDGHSVASTFIGNSLAPQEIYDGSENTRLTILSYEQKFINDRLDIEVGRLPAQGAFLVSPLYCDFQNVGVCGSPEIIFNDTNQTFFPASTYGGHAKFFFNDKIFFHAGAFEVKPSVVRANDHGTNFSFHDDTGYFLPIELGYTTTAADDRFPRNYGIGAIIDESSYPDPIDDVRGGHAFFSHLSPQERFGRSLVYGRFDQTVWRLDANSDRVLQIFGVASVGTTGRQPQDYQLEAGAVLTGPFASRPFDTIGFAVTDQSYSKLGISNVREARVAQGLSPGNVASSEVLMELNYGAQITPAVRLTPQLQYIINPDQNNEPLRRKPIPDAFVIGAKFSIDLLTLAGLAKGPGSH